MISIAKMVQAAKAAQIQTHLVQLVPALLESLSSMEVRATLLSSIHRQQHRIAPPCRWFFTNNSTARSVHGCCKQGAVAVLCMLMSWMSVQDQRLNYVEQHAERIGVDAGRLENLRVSAAKGSIMGDTLDVCARQVDAQSLEALVPVLSQLVKRGVGLNTQAGAARFISSLAMRMGTDIQPQSGALLKAGYIPQPQCP